MISLLLALCVGAHAYLLNLGSMTPITGPYLKERCYDGNQDAPCPDYDSVSKTFSLEFTLDQDYSLNWAKIYPTYTSYRRCSSWRFKYKLTSGAGWTQAFDDGCSTSERPLSGVRARYVRMEFENDNYKKIGIWEVELDATVAPTPQPTPLPTPNPTTPQPTPNPTPNPTTPAPTPSPTRGACAAIDCLDSLDDGVGVLSGSDGASNWLSDWELVGSESGVVAEGGSFPIKMRRQFTGDSSLPSATRDFSMAWADAVQLKVDWHVSSSSTFNSLDVARVLVSAGASSWTEVGALGPFSADQSGSLVVDVTSDVVTDIAFGGLSRVRVELPGNSGFGGADEAFFVDSVRVTGSCGPPTPEPSPPPTPAPSPVQCSVHTAGDRFAVDGSYLGQWLANDTWTSGWEEGFDDGGPGPAQGYIQVQAGRLWLTRSGARIHRHVNLGPKADYADVSYTFFTGPATLSAYAIQLWVAPDADQPWNARAWHMVAQHTGFTGQLEDQHFTAAIDKSHVSELTVIEFRVIIWPVGPTADDYFAIENLEIGAYCGATTGRPTPAPTTPSPTATPTAAPSAAPTTAPTSHPTPPIVTGAPTSAPTAVPTGVPSAAPSASPTASPTTAPTAGPTTHDQFTTATAPGAGTTVGATTSGSASSTDGTTSAGVGGGSVGGSSAGAGAGGVTTGAGGGALDNSTTSGGLGTPDLVMNGGGPSLEPASPVPIVVGVLVGLLLILGVGAGLLYYQRQRGARATSAAAPPAASAGKIAGGRRSQPPQSPRGGRPTEMTASNRPGAAEVDTIPGMLATGATSKAGYETVPTIATGAAGNSSNGSAGSSAHGGLKRSKSSHRREKARKAAGNGGAASQQPEYEKLPSVSAGTAATGVTYETLPAQSSGGAQPSVEYSQLPQALASPSNQYVTVGTKTSELPAVQYETLEPDAMASPPAPSAASASASKIVYSSFPNAQF